MPHLQPDIQVCHFVQQYRQEHVGIEVAVDTDLVVGVVALWPSVVAQLGSPFACDVQVYGMGVEDAVDAFHCPGREVAGENLFILFG